MTLPTVAVLAGGLATRLRPISLTIPKAMAPVGGEPFCRVQLRRLKEQGFEHVVMLIGVMGKQIRAEVGNGAAFGLRVDYVEDGSVPLGTGGAVLRALPQLGERFFVTYGDTLLTYDPHETVVVLDRTGADATMVVLRNDDRWDRSNVVIDGEKVLRYKKNDPDRVGMRWIDYGATLFRAAAFAEAQDDTAFDLSGLVERLATEGRVAAHEVHERFYEIGTPAALAEFELYLAGTGAL